MSDTEPHLITQLIADALVPRSGEWALPHSANIRIRAMLVSLPEDQELVEAVRSVFAMVFVLQISAGAPAAKSLLHSLAKVRNELLPRLRRSDRKGLVLSPLLLCRARALLPNGPTTPGPSPRRRFALAAELRESR